MIKLIFSRKALFAYLLAQAFWIILLTFFFVQTENACGSDADGLR